jgi:broad specificity phosphatase PhoE
VAVFDATNSTRERRAHILETLQQSGISAKQMFVESICDSRGMKEEDALEDFRKRRQQYMSVYVPIDESDGCSYVKIINSRKFIANNIRGYLKLKVVHFVMNLHTLPRTFFLTRHGQSEYNLLGKIGGDSGLSPAGVECAKRLAEFAQEHIATRHNENDGTTVQHVPARLWTSTLRRTKETAQFIQHPKLRHTWDNGDTGDWLQFRPMARRNLDELYARVCDGMTYKEIEKVYPEEFKRRQDDKLAYRYPRGMYILYIILYCYYCFTHYCLYILILFCIVDIYI